MSRFRLFPILTSTAIFAIAAFHASAEIKLASPFTDHMVLQREIPVPVWGTATPKAKVTVAFAGQEKSCEAAENGTWRVVLTPLQASTESRALMISETPGGAPTKLSDVLVGEVWLCSGQSNMDFSVAKTPKFYFAGVINEAAEIAAANYPMIRMFRGEPIRALSPQSHVPGAWQVCTPENVREFSAIGYFFARDLQKELKVPVGILTLTYGASTAQAWIRREAIESDPKLKPVLEEFDEKVKSYIPPSEEEQKSWQAEVEKAKAAGERPPRRPKPDPVQDQHNPTVLFNGMIAPILPYALRGILWYQGESITPPRELFPRWNELLITDWRKLWNAELPFYFCQLAAHQAASNGPEVRAWQTEALKLPRTGMAVTIDVGDAKDVHPHNKAPVGDRLVRIALAKTYGRTIEYSGPEYTSLSLKGGAIRLKFSHVANGLVARGGALKTFEIAGADGKFAPAEARIDHNTVVVASREVAAPVSARYAWSSYPEGCNLYNSADLPAAPFEATSAGHSAH